MFKGKTYIIIGIIFILAFFAGNIVYPQLLNLSFVPDIPFKLGLDLQGGSHLVYEADLSSIEKKDYGSSMQGLRDVIERRVNLFGVSEPIVQTQESSGQYRLIVELPGITDPNQAIEEIGKTPFLEFRVQRPYEELEKINKKREELEGMTYEEVQQVEDWELAFADPFEPTVLTGKYLDKAEIGFDQTAYQPIVLIKFNEEGAKIFEQLTSQNIGKQIAIYIDDAMISAPVVNETISGGSAQISGDFNVEEARELARNLNAGALPVPISLISQQSIGPTLGSISLEKSLKAGLYGFLLIILFMILFYRGSGIVSLFSLGIYVIFILTLFKIIPVTMTLAGIGGFILSIGMAIDANILIFSRMREELAEGNSFSYSVENGFNRAWPSIRDGNLTTLLVALILFFFGTSFIKGFALTLSIGIVVSIFCAVFITKNLLRIFANTKLENIKALWK